VAARFLYDVRGRRIGKTINSAATSYLYSGPNIVQEQSGGSASSNPLTGTFRMTIWIGR